MLSESDSFINEVSEEVRKDKLYKQFKKYGWILVLAVVAIVGGTAYNEWNKSKRTTEAEQAGDVLIAALVDSNPDALADMAGSDASSAVVAQLAQANLLVEQENLPAALEVLRAVANDLESAAVYTDLAWLKILMLDHENLAANERESIVDRLSAADGPYRLLALEQRAMQYVRDGDIAAANAVLQEILEDPGVTPGLRNRTGQMLTALGGDLEAGSENG